MVPLAHSGRATRGLGPQPYSAHVLAVRMLARKHASAALEYRAAPDPAFEAAAEWAGTFHDLGKLEAANQLILRTKESGGLAFNHVDAGVAHLAAHRQVEAAIAVYGHHIGLCDLPGEKAKDQRSGQNRAEAACRDPEIKLMTDANLPELIRQHHQAVPGGNPTVPTLLKRGFTGIERRLLLSCLVDADHTDTARHYGDQPDLYPGAGRWEERLTALDRYVSNLGRDTGKRSALRSEIYHVCRSASTDQLVWACDSPVGSGKTTAIMAYLLQAAIALGLRHIFIVLPYTNIVQQLVDVYRKAIVLAGENPEKIVAAHHHQAEFKSADLRFLTTLWDAPIIVTTAVQFFETLGANQTPRLRKLHQLPGSAIFIDEAHAAMPIHLWPFMWEQVKTLALGWSCRFVLGSGSLAKFWENPRILGGKAEAIPPMIPDATRDASSIFEQSRISYRSRPDTLTMTGLCDWVQTSRGARLVVLNTVQSAAVIAEELSRRGELTLHLSTALAPIHRKTILRLIRSRLKMKPNMDWVLVATSCVEAGVDFSFAIAFRERCRISSLVQIGGRVNRHGERSEGVVWDFVVNDPLLTVHPDFKSSRDVVDDVFRKGMWDRDLTELMTYALDEEFKRKSEEQKIADLMREESAGSYPTVANLTRLITADTRLVVIDAALIKAVREGCRVDHRELVARSVQLWFTKVNTLSLTQIGHGEELYAWEYEYDPRFLGIMAGILKLSQVDRDRYAFV